MNVTNLPNLTGRMSGRQLALFSLLLLYILGSSFSGYAQSDMITINGKVIASDDKQPIIGASITDASKKNIGVTNLNGEFSVKIQRNSSITISYLGFSPVTRQFSADQNGINISLSVANTALTEVVVTALGIKREEKALGYAVTTLGGDQLTDAVSNNWTDALSGKVAGLNLVRSNGGPSGSNKIILRGENNLTGDNEALIVVDGVVINNGSGRSTASGTGGYLSEETPVDFGNGIGDLNPEDIESVTVLKGPGAAALYGQRGANGAVIITTKSGKTNKKGLGITFNSNSAISTITRWPDLQYEYGQGLNGDNYYSFLSSEDGSSTRSTSSAWGPRFDGQMFYQYDPVTHTKATERTPWIPYVNDSRNFFNDAATFTNSVTLDGGGEKTSARFSYTNANNKWIIPNTGYNRNSVALSVRQKMNDKLTLSTKVNYTNKSSDNLPSTGYNNQSIMYWYLFWVPNANIDWLKDYWLPGKTQQLQSYPFSSLPDNPYLIANQMLNKSNRNTITGSAQATYDFTKKLSLMVRTSIDLSQELRSQQRPFDTEKFKRGMYRTQGIYSQEVNSDFLLSYKTKIKKDFDVSASFGGSMLKNIYNRDYNKADSLLYP
ncbi:MAG TPA: TonB-dependent receptor plug domain-containing protein, partial [Pelobium sp.]|nr:TonB-dependent receptor plug domain-containing protein [Pelobium sp.]